MSQSRHKAKAGAGGGRLRGRETNFKCEFLFENKVPEVPTEAKLLKIPIDNRLLSADVLAAIESKYRYPPTLGDDLGLNVDICETALYTLPPEGAEPLHPNDAALLDEDDEVAEAFGQKSNPKLVAPWLMNTTYISKFDSEILAAKENKRTKEMEVVSRETLLREQIQSIEESFEAAKKKPVHPTRPELEVVEVLPVLPDVERDQYYFYQVRFDEPAGPEADIPWTEEEPQEADRVAVMDFATRGKRAVNAKSRSYVSYMLPTTLAEGAEVGDEGTEYLQTKEYSYSIFDDVDSEQRFAIWVGNGKATYLGLSGDITLSVDHDGSGEAGVPLVVPKKITKRKRAIVEEKVVVEAALVENENPSNAAKLDAFEDDDLI